MILKKNSINIIQIIQNKLILRNSILVSALSLVSRNSTILDNIITKFFLLLELKLSKRIYNKATIVIVALRSNN